MARFCIGIVLGRHAVGSYNTQSLLAKLFEFIMIHPVVPLHITCFECALSFPYCRRLAPLCISDLLFSINGRSVFKTTSIIIIRIYANIYCLMNTDRSIHAKTK